MFVSYFIGCNITIDLVFLVDGTKDMKMSNFKRVLRFIKNLAKVLHISKHGTHVGLVFYGDDSKVAFNLKQYLSLTNLSHALSKLKLPKARKRYIGTALLRANNDVFEITGRDGVPKVLILLQNKKSKDGIGYISQQVKKYGVKIFAIGRGNKRVKGQLKEIASKPVSLYYKTAKYKDMDTAYFVQAMKESICMGMLKNFLINKYMS